MRIITFNLNGIRSAHKKGFFDWLKIQDADVICVQELKAHEHQIKGPEFTLPDYHAYFHYAEKKGYSGVGIYSRKKPNKAITGLGFECADNEGRYVEIEYDHINIASLYMPSGTSGEIRQNVKFDFLNRYEAHLKEIQGKAKPYIICGDWNIAHREIDLKNWRSNQKNSGFLPEERAWLDKVFDHFGFVDAFRVVNQEKDQYTWWSYRGRAREKNVGWRIDYQVISPQLKPTVKSALIYTQQCFSDHAPLAMEYDMIL